VTVTAGTNFTATGLQTGKKYYFAVTAIDAAENESQFSNEVSKTVQ
jgi:fibronectin type 3 domain-containing protein